MIQRKRILFSVVLIVALFASLWMMNLTSVQAAPKPTPTPIPTLPTPLPPGTYYVSISGNDNNSGTVSLPWRHIQYALDHVGAGSTVNVLTGVYDEKVTFPRSGTSGNYIVLQNYMDNSPVIDGNARIINGTVMVLWISAQTSADASRFAAADIGRRAWRVSLSLNCFLQLRTFRKRISET